MIKKKIITLDNGLKIIIVNDNTKHIQYAELNVRYGGRTKLVKVNDEVIKIKDGIAHLLEHTLFENTIYGNLNNYFREKYIETNAFTSYDSTGFYIETVENFDTSLKELIKAIHTPIYTDDDLNIIKPPIYEEIKMTHDRKYKKFHDACTHNILVSNDYIDNVGSVDIIKTIDKEYLDKIYKIFYQPKNEVITLRGNFDINNIVNIINDTYKELNIENIDYEVLDDFSSLDFRERKVIVKDSKYNENYNLTFKIDIHKFSKTEINKLSYYLNYYISTIFSDESDAFIKIIKEGYSKYSINRSISFSYLDKILLVELAVETTNIDEVREILIDTIKNYKIDKKDFDLNHKKLVLNKIIPSKNIYKVFSEYVNNILYFNFNNVDSIKFIESLNYDECVNLINKLDFSNYAEVIQIKE